MELISRDEAIVMLEDMEGRRDEDGYIRVYKLDVIANLRSLSSIDLVTCGECKYWTGDCTNEIWQSPTDDYLPQTNADDFCSYGERRSDER